MEHRRGDRAIGIALGVIVGIAVVVGFVFLGSEQTVDAPRIKGGTQSTRGTGRQPAPKQAGVPVVTVESGGPPASGPPKLEFKQGQRVRFKVKSDSAVEIEILSIPGQTKTVPSGGSATFDFTAKKAGLFAVIIPATHIAVASLQIAK